MLRYDKGMLSQNPRNGMAPFFGPFSRRIERWKWPLPF
jgi:hypothetical protein